MSNKKNKNREEESFEETEGVSTILGDPKKAILKLSWPLIIAMLISSFYVLVDGIWVSGLGPDALTAVGFIVPVFLVVMGFSNGLGAGATAIISRFIGERDKLKANNAALHVMILILVFTVIVMISLGLFLHPILELLGAGITAKTISLALDYGYVIFGGSIFIIFTSAAYGILRGEGNVKKATYAMSFGAILNIILDPIFIYTFGWGMTGAGLATIVSLAIVSIIILHWFRGDTYVSLSLNFFDFSKDILKKILAVSIPVGAEFLIFSILAGSLNIIFLMAHSAADGAIAVAVYSSGWRVVMISVVPILAVSMSVVAVVGASFGAKNYENIEIIQNYAIKIGTLIAIITAIVTFILAPYIADVFTYSPETAGLHDLITEYLRVMTLFYIFIPLGSVSSSIFQGVGRGLDSFMLTAIRELLLIMVFAYILAIPLGMGQQGAWWGIVIGDIFGAIIAYLWAKNYINGFKTFKNDEKIVLDK